EAEVQVAVLAPGGGEALVEAADGFEGGAGAEAVGGDELGVLQAGLVALVVGGPRRQRHDGAAGRGRGASGQRLRSGGPPARIGDAVVVGEGDDGAGGGAPAGVAGGGGAAGVVGPDVAERRPGAVLHLAPGRLAAGVVGNDHLVGGRLELLIG